MRNINSGDSLEDIKPGDKVTFINRLNQVFTCISIGDAWGKETVQLSAPCETCSEIFETSMGRTATYPTRKCKDHRKRAGEQKAAPVKDFKGMCYMEYAVKNGSAAPYEERKPFGEELAWDQCLGTRDGSLLTMALWDAYNDASKRLERKHGLTNAWCDALEKWALKNNLILMEYGVPCEFDTPESAEIARSWREELRNHIAVDDIIG